MKFFFWIAAAFLLPFSAFAYDIKISNLDNATHIVQVNNAGEVRDYTLKPWDVVHVTGSAVKLRLKDSKRRNSDLWGVAVRRGSGEFTTRFGDEYVIWPGGKLSLQRYGKVGRAH